MIKFNKTCSCGIKCNSKNTKLVGETNGKNDRVLYWVNCACGSTLVTIGYRLDFAEINKVITNETENVLVYGKGV